MNMMAVEAFSAERWNQRRVNVDDPVFKVVRNLNKAQEAAENYEVDFGFASKIKDSLAESLDRVEF